MAALARAGTVDFGGLCADRTSVEKVYYNHRLGEKPPFEIVSPPSQVERLVRENLRKKSVLKRVYGVEIGDLEIATEVRRIDTTTRAPDTLADLKSALNNDASRFAHTVAEPILVDRELRKRFSNDDGLHADQRRVVERIRQRLLAAKTNTCQVACLLAQLKASDSNHVSELTWKLGPPPPEIPSESREEMEVKKRFGPEAHLLAGSREGFGKRTLYFDNLPALLQRVLAAQLNQPGDVSAVIESPGGFALYLTVEKTDETLRVVALSIPKRSYEEWLNSLDLPGTP